MVYAVTATAMTAAATELSAYQLSADLGVEYWARRVRYSSGLNPGNINDENQFSNLITGSVSFKNDFSDNINGMIRLGAESAPARYRNSDPSERVYIRETYIDFLQENYSVRVGKQFIKWGDGVFFNPSDVVNISRDPLRPANDAEGVSFAQLAVPLGSFASIDF